MINDKISPLLKRRSKEKKNANKILVHIINIVDLPSNFNKVS